MECTPNLLNPSSSSSSETWETVNLDYTGFRWWSQCQVVDFNIEWKSSRFPAHWEWRLAAVLAIIGLTVPILISLIKCTRARAAHRTNSAAAMAGASGQSKGEMLFMVSVLVLWMFLLVTYVRWEMGIIN